jgi:alpha-ketoglutarate-dependent taurine dioxygenase
MNDVKILFQALEALERDGLVLITGVPDRASQDGSGPITVEDIALRVGYIKDTFYGRSWDVVSTPDAKNVAYTSVYLPLHMDLCYYESPPGIQLLHVIENSASGGESVFADSYAAALHILATDPQAYDALTKIPVTYHYVNDGHHYYFSRPTIVENPSGPIDPTTGRRPVSHLNYSPPFQGPLDAIATANDDSGCGFSDSTVAAFMRGLREFEKYIESQENQLTAKIPNGTCMLFQNRRILHGRREFTSDAGRRWLKGTYLDIDCFESKLRTLASSENL